MKKKNNNNISINVFGYEDETSHCINTSKETFKKHVKLYLKKETRSVSALIWKT